MKSNNRNIEALFGKSKYHELCGNFEDAKDVLNSLVVCYGKFAPPLIEKSKVELALQVPIIGSLKVLLTVVSRRLHQGNVNCNDISLPG